MTKRQIAFSFLAFSLMASANTRPWTFWYWMYGAVSKAGIHADLQGMKDVGLGGCYLMPIRGTNERPDYKGTAQQLTSDFWDMVDYSFQQADSLGLQMGVHICDGFALAGSPAIKPAESMQKVVWSDTIVSGGKIKNLVLRQPEAYQGCYEDIATYAVQYAERPQIAKPNSVSLSEAISTAKGYYLASKPAQITYAFDAPVTVRSMRITPHGNNVQSQRLLVQKSDDGVTYTDVKQLVPPRQGWQNTQCDYTFSLPTTTAKYFRFAWTPEGTEPGAEDLDAAKWKTVLKLDSIQLSNAPVINQYEGKSAAVWRIDATTDTLYDKVKNVIRLDASNGAINTKLPKGTWRIIRMGHASTGQMNATAGGGKGLEVDKFSVDATTKLFNSWFALFLQRPHADVVKYLHIDSWECGSQNWGYRFADEFKARRGYDLLEYLPVMAGVPMQNAEKALKDVRLTINELVNEKFFQIFTTLAHDRGMLVSHESIAPTFPADGLEHYKYSDNPMGEYWLNSPTHDKPNDMLDAISGAHIYGKNIVQAEGFTEVRGVWNETPAMIKPLLDRNFALGMNKLFFHVNAHNPWLDRKPGMTLDGIGLFFQRDNTWYPLANGFVDYITRCQNILQQGKPVVDIAVFTGEEMPCRSLTPDRLVPMLPGLFGAERVASEKARLANVGQPMEESPVGVTHSAGILDLKDWCNALHGYKYDSMNRDVLLSTDADKFPYKVLVLPQTYFPGQAAVTLSAEVKQKVEQLKKSGVVVIDKPLTTSLEPSTSNLQPTTFNLPPSTFHLPPDIVLPDNMDYAHRKAEHSDYYFITNQQNEARTVTATFRQPSDASVSVVGMEMNQPIAFTQKQTADGRPQLTFDMPANGSVVVDFGKAAATPQVVTTNAISVHDLPTKWTAHFESLDKDTVVTLPFGWTTSADPNMRNYSGIVTLTSSVLKSSVFPVSTTNASLFTLKLGKVYDVAEVSVNGKVVGNAWTAPYEVLVPTDLIKKGKKNVITIRIANTWHNALQATDEGNPPYPGIWTNAKYRTKSKALLPAGIGTLQAPLKGGMSD